MAFRRRRRSGAQRTPAWCRSSASDPICQASVDADEGDAVAVRQEIDPAPRRLTLADDKLALADRVHDERGRLGALAGERRQTDGLDAQRAILDRHAELSLRLAVLTGHGVK